MHELPNFFGHDKVIFFFTDVRSELILGVDQPLVVNRGDGGDIVVF